MLVAGLSAAAFALALRRRGISAPILPSFPWVAASSRLWGLLVSGAPYVKAGTAGPNNLQFMDSWFYVPFDRWLVDHSLRDSVPRDSTSPTWPSSPRPKTFTYGSDSTPAQRVRVARSRRPGSDDFTFGERDLRDRAARRLRGRVGRPRARPTWAPWGRRSSAPRRHSSPFLSTPAVPNTAGVALVARRSQLEFRRSRAGPSGR